ncbi:MarR family transcriptional regulator [Nocardia sp. NEAU-G5]|uniref:MarR family transcriptional regulator n=1 Tax=Nocardia albiluteola TaxID=2842303 RepID=A0ABS6B272_9NOCA|nr:MarR family transcriptional regulator [Nocardia albiluteola]MBU3064398.1 MarR family transcriptional regulator [Nocardia albiluteola]
MPDDGPTPDEVWQLLLHVVGTRDKWKRAVTERTGLPFSRIKILRTLRSGSMTVKELAAAAAMDSPAATVTVNDLEERGLVLRTVDPGNRRCKVVSITDHGREVVAKALATHEPAPESLGVLTDSELLALRDLLRKIDR